MQETIEIKDSSEARLFLGERDASLRLLREALAIDVVARDSFIRISGEPDKVEVAAGLVSNVLKELRAYSPMVSLGSYIIVQDTGIGKPAKPWFPWASHAVEEFMRNNDRFEIDRSRQRYIVTNNPDGYLKRVR